MATKTSDKNAIFNYWLVVILAIAAILYLASLAEDPVEDSPMTIDIGINQTDSQEVGNAIQGMSDDIDTSDRKVTY